MTPQSPSSPHLLWPLAIAVACLCSFNAHAAPQSEPGLGRGLRELAAAQDSARADVARRDAQVLLAKGALTSSAAQFDADGRVLVVVNLDGRRTFDAVRLAAQDLGVKVVGEARDYRRGAFSVYLPLSRARALAHTQGVRSVILAMPPVVNAGKALSQGAALMHSDTANASGYTGKGVTVAAMSDSFDTANPRPMTKAGGDVQTGDLPGTRNPEGDLTPVVVSFDGIQATDEGRAMLQIVHDVAPGARLCFTSAFPTAIAFANGILSLADKKSGLCGADVIVDDVAYLDEPMFEDGLVAQAVDAVAAQGVAYFSAAGNQPTTNGYAATFTPVDDATARATTMSVDLSLIPPGTTMGGFHNFAAAATGGVDVAQRIVVDAQGRNTLILQWNDPYDLDGMTADYDLYVFTDDGKTLLGSAADQNAFLGEPIEGLNLPPGVYKIVLARADADTGRPFADQLRYVVFGDVLSSSYAGAGPTMYGHAAAQGAIATAAVPFFQSDVAGPYTSNGPVAIWFDASEKRLAAPLIRQKPDVAAPDGVNTTFFYADSGEDADKQPNFFGTSAAAPHAAGVAALMLQKAGGRENLKPAYLKRILQETAQAHDLKPSSSSATATVGKATVKIGAVGQGLSGANNNPNAFSVSLSGQQGWSIRDLSFNLASANATRMRLGVAAPGLYLDPRPRTGYPVTFGALHGLTAEDITPSTLSTSG